MNDHMGSKQNQHSKSLKENEKRESVIQRKIHKHLVDINDKITDDDIRNYKITIPPPAIPPHESLIHKIMNH